MRHPFTGEHFWATPDCARGERAGKRYPLRTREVSDLSQVILHTMSPEHYDGALKHGLDRLTAAVAMIRFGGESYAVAMLVAGYIDLCLEPAL
jgi:fructose-1,6-bisphosphatase/inositol monophosphatase family enzyme